MLAHEAALLQLFYDLRTMNRRLRVSRLSATFVRSIKRPGRYGDGHGSGGLSLLVRRTAAGKLAKSWAQRIHLDGSPRNLGLGSWPHVSLAEAREKCALNLAARRSGEPMPYSDPERTIPTFQEAVEEVIALYRAGWKDDSRSENQWRASLRDYAIPILGEKPVHQINSADVMAVLQPIWNDKGVTARRVRNRVSAVMRWAVARGYRQDNPAGEAIQMAFPRTRVPIRNRPALAYSEVRGAIEKVRGSGTYPTTTLAFEFLVLTACRSGEVRGARWEELDLEAREWRIPPERMKTGREHRVPLSTRALAVLREASEFAHDSTGLVFPSRHRGRLIADTTFSKLMRKLRIAAVPHGFRSSFRDWAAECSDAPREVCELALAHVNSDRVERAYRRTDLFARRRALMEQWSAFLAQSQPL